MTSYLLSALAAWWGFRKFRSVVDAYREINGPKEAKPFTSLVYRWSNELHNQKTQELVLEIGNREKRQLIIKDIMWVAPALRLKWASEPKPPVQGLRLPEGEGIEVEFDPNATLKHISQSNHFSNSLKKFAMLSSLRLVIILQTGEQVALRAPPYFRSFLAKRYGVGKLVQTAVYLHHRVWP